MVSVLGSFSNPNPKKAASKRKRTKKYIKRVLKDWKTWLLLIISWVFFGFTLTKANLLLDFEALILVFFVYSGGFLAIAWGFLRFQEKNLIESTPTYKIRSLPLGVGEIKGEARPAYEDGLLTSPLSQKECIFYEYSVMERRRKHDSDGTDDDYWKKIDGGKDWAPFFIEDDTGRVLVDPREAEEEFEVDVTHRVDSNDPLPGKLKDYVQNNPNIQQSNRSRVYTETFVQPGEDLYVFGKALEREVNDNLGDVVIGKDSTTPLFRISDKPEKEILKKYEKGMKQAFIGGSVLILISYGVLMFILGMI